VADDVNNAPANAERERMEQQARGELDWRLWGPYLAERAWGTVREDYSPDGEAWDYFDHEQSRARAYRWNEDGMAGISDERQRLCLALALWNGRDPILKERAFGLTGPQGNHGEDVKEYFFYQDATPSHSYLRYLYKYPQVEYPYRQLIDENAKRGRHEPSYNLLDSGAFDDSRYWDVTVVYAKDAPDKIHLTIHATNRGPDEATLHLLPHLWFRNTWSWDEPPPPRPVIEKFESPTGAAWAVRATEPTLGSYYLYGETPAETLFTDNETNQRQLLGGENSSPYVKDAFHHCVVNGDEEAVNPAQSGTKFAAWHSQSVPAGQSFMLQLVLSAAELAKPFDGHGVITASRRSEADVFYDDLLPDATPEDHRIMRQSLGGMIWSKQYYHYDVQRWLDGDRPAPPPAERRDGRNAGWRHVEAADIISMPDCWEYPWFAAWDLAYHCAALALIDVEFAKHQIELMLNERYLNPNGQIPAYEWDFGDTNPPVHAAGALKVFRAERVQHGVADLDFLKRVFNKLLLNYAWWINRKDKEGHNLFEGGFLGLDNISVYDRSKPLPPGYTLKQADATGWMAMFALHMTIMALELAVEDPNYEDIAIQCYEQFLAIANAIAGGDDHGVSLWNDEAGFFTDVLVTPEGTNHRIDVYSWVGLIPLFACEVIDQRLLGNVPRFRDLLLRHKQGLFRGHEICACPNWENERGEHLLALVNETMLPRILAHLLSEDEFLSRYGVRGVSRIHATHQDLGSLPGIGEVTIEYVPGESTSDMFGGNSNWRGPVWMPTNYTLVLTLEKYHRFLGDGFRAPIPFLEDTEMNLQEIATLIAERLVDLYRRDEEGRVPALRGDSPFQDDPHWQDLCFFYEYFHADTGEGLGAAHQTGWTGLLANLVMRRHRKHIPAYWRGAD